MPERILGRMGHRLRYFQLKESLRSITGQKAMLY